MTEAASPFPDGPEDMSSEQQQRIENNVVPGNPSWFQAAITDTCAGLFAYGGTKGRLTVLDMHTGSYVGSVKAHDGRPGVTCVRFVEHDRAQKRAVVITGGSDGFVKRWSVDASGGSGGGPTLVSSEKASGPVRALAVSEGGALYAVGDQRGALTVRGAAPRGEVFATRLAQGVSCLAYCGCPGGASLLAAGLEDGSIVLLDGATVVFTWRGPHTKTVQSLSWRASERNGLFLASGGMDRRLVVWKLWRADDGEWAYQTVTLAVPKGVESGRGAAHSGQNRVWNCVAWCPFMGHEDVLYTTANSSPVVLKWSLADTVERWHQRSVPPPGQPPAPQVLQGNNRSVFTVSFINGPTPAVVSTSMGKQVTKWCFKTGRALWRVPTLSAGPLSLAVSSTGLLAYGEASVVTWQLPRSHHAEKPKEAKGDAGPYAWRECWSNISSPVTVLAHGPDGSIAFGTKDGDVGLLVDTKGKGVFKSSVLLSTGSRVVAAAWVSPGRLLFVGRTAVQVVSVEGSGAAPAQDLSAALSAALPGLANRGVSCAAYAAGLLVAASDGFVCGLRVGTVAAAAPEQVFSQRLHGANIESLALCSGGEGLTTAVACTDGVVLATPLADGGGLGATSSVRAHRGRASCVAWSACGRRLYSCGVDGRVVLCDWEDGVLRVSRALQHGHPLGLVCVSPVNAGVVYAADETCLLALHADAAVPAEELATPAAVATTEAAGGPSASCGGVAPPAKRARLLVSSAEWFAGVDGGDAHLALLGDGAGASDALATAQALLGVPAAASLSSAVHTGVGLDSAVAAAVGAAPAGQAEAAAALLALHGTFGEAAGRAAATCPDAGAFWVALARSDGYKAWAEAAEAWRRRLSAGPVKAAVDLSAGDAAAAAQQLGAERRHALAQRLLEEAARGGGGSSSKGLGAEEAAAAVRAALEADRDVPPLARCRALLRVGRRADAADALAGSGDLEEVKAAVALCPTQASTDGYAARWLAGDDDSVRAPPGAGEAGGVGRAPHCAWEVRKALALPAAEFRSQCADRAGTVVAVKGWMARMGTRVPDAAKKAVGHALEVLGEG